MSAPAKAPAASKAARFADDAEALGWSVTREKLAEGGRRVTAVRDGETYELAWHRNAAGVLAFTYGTSWLDDGDAELPVSGPAPALKAMSQVRLASGASLPFNPATATDIDVLEACAGRHLTWTTSYGVSEDGDTPRGGVHYKLTGEADARVLHFADQIRTGFRSVRIANITKVV